jgi:CDP-6-deoxy-D-xylo-4-hexulose-3-dehydrase
MIFLTNILGFCHDIDNIKEMCRKRKILLAEDNCEALGTVYKGKKLGNYGLASTFSFYVGHHMSTIEGGAICTDDIELANQLRIVRAHGWDRNLSEARQNSIRDKFKVNSTFYSRYTFYDLGFNLRPTEINGFIGNVQLKYIDEITRKRNRNFKKFAVLYRYSEKYFPIKFNHIDFVSNFAIPVICKTKKIRDLLVDACSNRVEIRPIVGGDISSQPFFKKYAGLTFDNPNARLVHEQGLYFGNNPELTKQEIQSIVKIFSTSHG